MLDFLVDFVRTIGRFFSGLLKIKRTITATSTLELIRISPEVEDSKCSGGSTKNTKLESAESTWEGGSETQ